VLGCDSLENGRNGARDGQVGIGFVLVGSGPFDLHGQHKLGSRTKVLLGDLEIAFDNDRERDHLAIDRTVHLLNLIQECVECRVVGNAKDDNEAAVLDPVSCRIRHRPPDDQSTAFEEEEHHPKQTTKMMMRLMLRLGLGGAKLLVAEQERVHLYASQPLPRDH